jgi:hypothetical protein
MRNGDASTKREEWRAFLPLVLGCLFIRLCAGASMVFRADGSRSSFVTRDELLPVAEYIGCPILLVFFAAKFWRSRDWRPNPCILLLSVIASAIILSMYIGEADLRLLLNKSRYQAVAEQRPDAAAIVFDWGEAPTLFSLSLWLDYLKEYLVIARGEAAATLDQSTGREIGSWGDDRDAIERLLMSDWNKNDLGRRFGMRRFDACRMKVSHLWGSYYYVVDRC